MKSKLILFLAVIFTLPTFAQLNKTVVEAKFPLLNLPYDTKGLLFMSYNIKEQFNPAKAKFVGEEISDIIKKYLNTNLFINENAKHYAIGRLNYANRSYVIYLEASMNPDTKTGLNEIFIISLDEAYQPINMQSLSYYTQEFQEIKNPDNQFIKTDHAFSALSAKENKLTIDYTLINREDKFPGDIKLQYSKTESEHYFDEDGILNQIYK